MYRDTNAAQVVEFKKYPLELTSKLSSGDRIGEFYLLTLTDEAAKKEFDLVALEKNDAYEVTIYRVPCLPDDWRSMSLSEREIFVEENEFDIRVQGIYIHKNLDRNLLVSISCYTEVANVKIYENQVSVEDYFLLAGFSRLESLALRGKNITDDIAPLFKNFLSLQTLDIYGTSITQTGAEKIRSFLSWDCTIYGP